MATNGGFYVNPALHRLTWLSIDCPLPPPPLTTFSEWWGGIEDDEVVSRGIRSTSMALTVVALYRPMFLLVVLCSCWLSARTVHRASSNETSSGEYTPHTTHYTHCIQLRFGWVRARASQERSQPSIRTEHYYVTIGTWTPPSRGGACHFPLEAPFVRACRSILYTVHSWHFVFEFGIKRYTISSIIEDRNTILCA